MLAGAQFACEDYGAALLQIEQMSNPAAAFRIAAAARALIGDVAGARRVMKASINFNPNFDLRSWLAMAPCRDKDFIQRYGDGWDAGLADRMSKARGLKDDRPGARRRHAPRKLNVGQH